MSQLFINLFLVILIKIITSFQICEEGKNNCNKCDYIKQICIKCNNDIYIPDEKGGVNLPENVLLE